MGRQNSKKNISIFPGRQQNKNKNTIHKHNRANTTTIIMKFKSVNEVKCLNKVYLCLCISIMQTKLK